MKSTPAGTVGMLGDRPVFIGVTSGGVFTGDRANQPDLLTPYLSLAFGSIGLKSLQFLPRPGPGAGGEGERYRSGRPDHHGDLRSVYGRPASDRASAPKRAGRGEDGPLSAEILAALSEAGVARHPSPFTHATSPTDPSLITLGYRSHGQR